MVRAACASFTLRACLWQGRTAHLRVAALLSTRHILIASRQNIKKRANPFTTNEKTFSNGTRYLLKMRSHQLCGLSTDSRYSNRFPLTALIAC
jgi:hypothetical protein